MPYEVVHKGTGVVVRNKATGKIHAKNTTKRKAAAQLRLLNAVDHGWKPSK